MLKVLISGNGSSIKTRVNRIVEREKCQYRHDNGNCLSTGGFCFSVDDDHCKLKQSKGLY